MASNSLMIYINKINRAEDWITEQVGTWEKVYKLYMGKKKVIKGRANLHIPVMFMSINTVATRLLFSIFGQPPYVRAKPLNPEGVEKSKLAEKVINYYLGHREHFKDYYMFTINTLLYDIGALKIIFNKKKDYVMPRFYVINPWDLYFDVDAPRLRDITWVGHRKEVHISYIKNKIKNGEFKRIKYENLRGGKPVKDNDIIKDNEDYYLPENPDYVELIEIIDIAEHKRIVIGNRSVILVEEDYDDPLPYILVNCYPIAGNIKGLADAELIIDLQKEINAKRNQRLDNVTRILNQMYFVRPKSIINPERLANPVPGGIIYGFEKPEPLIIPDLTSNLIMEEERPFRDIERALGVYDIVRGEMTSKRESATEVMTASQSANMRFWLKTKFLENDFIVELGYKLLAYARKYSKKFIVEMREGEFTEVEPDDLDPENFDFVAVASSQVNNIMIERNQFQLLLTLFMKFFPNLVNKEGIAEYLLDLYGIQEKDKILLNFKAERPPLTSKEYAQALSQILQQATSGMPMGTPTPPEGISPMGSPNPPGMRGVTMPPLTQVEGENE